MFTLISCRLRFYTVDVNTVSHKLVARAGVTVSSFHIPPYIHSFQFAILICVVYCLQNLDCVLLHLQHINVLFHEQSWVHRQ